MFGTLEHSGTLPATRASTQRMVPEEPEKNRFIGKSGFIRETEIVIIKKGVQSRLDALFFFRKNAIIYLVKWAILSNFANVLRNRIELNL